MMPALRRFISLSECLDGGENVGIHMRRVGRRRTWRRERQCGHELLVGIDDVLGNFLVGARSVRGRERW